MKDSKTPNFKIKPTENQANRRGQKPGCHTDVATRLAALNDSLWRFLVATVGAFDEDYEVFSQRARAYLISRASRLVPGAAQATHHFDEGTDTSPTYL